MEKHNQTPKRQKNPRSGKSPMTRKVFAYKNLHKDCWSFKVLEGPEKGRVKAWVDKMALKDVVFKVGQAGRLRVIKEKQKNVHAGLVGRPADRLPEGVKLTRRVRYEPYSTPTFQDAMTGEPIHRAAWAYMDAQGRVFVS